MQQIKLIQRNFSTTVKSVKGVNTYVTVPEKLIDFQDRVNRLSERRLESFFSNSRVNQ